MDNRNTVSRVVDLLKQYPKEKYKKDPLQNMNSFGSFNQIINELDKDD